MTRSSKFRSIAAAIGALTLAAACGGSSSAGPTETLAADQTYRFGLVNDITSLDPGHVDAAVDITFLNEVFAGLYRFDNNLKIVPYSTTSMPEISSDGLTWTFHLRHDMQFSNGDKITAKDWMWSWARTLRLLGSYSSNLEPIKGATDVEAGTATTISGLTAPDDYTLKAQLVAPAGYWLTQLAMPTASEVLDQKVITAAGDDHWTESVTTYIGSGPWKMTQRTPKQSMDFAPVKNWWGGDTGKLTAVHVDIGIDQTSLVKKFESGGYDVVGPANNPPGPDDILRYKSDPVKNKLLTIYPGARTSGVGFNFVNGPFASKPGATPGSDTTNSNDPGKNGRIAFAESIDRGQLIDIACVHGATCQPATGGPISKGFKGYLGDNGDQYAKFDVAAAKAALDAWDPNKTKRVGLIFRYNSSATNDKYFGNLQSQWKANLGVDVQLVGSDFPTLEADRKAKRVIFGRESWSIDYDHPQDWFDNLYSCAQAKIGRGNDEAYCNPAMDQITQAANALPIDQALPQYVKAAQMLTQDLVWASLTYGTQSYLAQSYLRGEGFNALYDYNWEGIRLLSH
jgi:oligopeptide transport system substrate-binding protein